MLTVRACYLIVSAVKSLQSPEPMEEKWNEMYQQELIEIAKVHTMLVTYQIFKEGVKHSWLQETTKKHLCDLCKTFAAHDVYKNCSSLFE